MRVGWRGRAPSCFKNGDVLLLSSRSKYIGGLKRRSQLGVGTFPLQSIIKPWFKIISPTNSKKKKTEILLELGNFPIRDNVQQQFSLMLPMLKYKILKVQQLTFLLSFEDFRQSTLSNRPCLDHRHANWESCPLLDVLAAAMLSSCGANGRESEGKTNPQFPRSRSARQENKTRVGQHFQPVL